MTTSTTLYENCVVELISDDDVTMTAVVNNRQGITLEVIEGPFEARTASAGYVIHTANVGDVFVVPLEGCGCGGTSVTQLNPEDATSG